MAALESGDLFALAMKLLNSPAVRLASREADAAVLFHNIRVVLSHVIGDDVVRTRFAGHLAPRKEHQLERAKPGPLGLVPGTVSYGGL